METPGATTTDAPLSSLLERVAAGDREAFARVYDATCRRAYGLALRVTAQPTVAEDVVQEAYLQVWRSAADFTAGRGAPVPWILTIVHRRSVDAVRSQTARERRERVVAAREPRSVPDVREEVEARETAREVGRCLGDLTDLQRESIAMSYLDGLTYREVADRLDSPLPTVKSRIRGAMRSLRDCLEGVA